MPEKKKKTKKATAPKRKINSKAKGSRGELELVHFLKGFGLASARRTEQFCGNSGDAADVVAKEAEGIHWECKRTECLQIHKALAQAIADSKGARIPIVMYKRNHSNWIAILEAETLIGILKKAGLVLEACQDYQDTPRKEGTHPPDASSIPQ